MYSLLIFNMPDTIHASSLDKKKNILYWQLYICNLQWICGTNLLFVLQTSQLPWIWKAATR